MLKSIEKVLEDMWKKSKVLEDIQSTCKMLESKIRENEQEIDK